MRDVHMTTSAAGCRLWQLHIPAIDDTKPPAICATYRGRFKRVPHHNHKSRIWPWSRSRRWTFPCPCSCPVQRNNSLVHVIARKNSVHANTISHRNYNNVERPQMVPAANGILLSNAPHSQSRSRTSYLDRMKRPIRTHPLELGHQASEELKKQPSCMRQAPRMPNHD